MSMALGDLMARVGLQSLSNSLAGQLAAASPAEAQPEMVQVRLGRTSPAPFYPLDPSPADVAAASAAVADLQAQQRAAHAHKKHRKHRRHHNAEGDEHADGPADPADPELGYPQYEDYAHPHHHHHGHRKTRGAPADSAVPEFEYAAVDFAALDPELRFASPLPPPDPEPDEPAPMFLPIPSPPTPSGIPEWLAPLFPPVTALPAFLQLRHPTLGMNVGARAWILTLVALWVILSYLPFFPPSGSATAFSADAANHTLAFDHAGTDIYNVSTFAGYSHFRNIGLLNTNTGQSSFLPAWSEFVSSGANGTRNDTPADACAAFLGSRGWVLPGYTVTGIPDFSVTNDTSTVVVTWNGPMAGRAVPRWNGGPALHSAFEYLDRAINNLTSSPMTFGQPSRSASILRSAPGRMYSKDSDPILAWDDKSTQDVVDGETGDYVNPKTGLRTVVAAGLRWTAVRVKATGTEGGKAAVFVAGMDTPPNDPPPNTLSTPPALLLALLRHLLNPTSPALPYDILLLWTSGTSAPTQHYTLSAPTSAWYADSGMTGLLMQPGFRDFTTSEMWKSAAPAAVVWLGPVGPGALEVDYAAEMRGSWQPSGDGSGRQVWERTRRLQGVPRWGAGSSIGRHLRMRSNVTWNAPFLGPLWDAGFDALSARSMDAGEGERTRFVHAYTRGAIDSADWGARPTHAGLEAVGGWLRGIAADPGQLEADAAYGLDHAGTNYYPLASGMASYSLAGAWAFAGIDMVLATLALAFAFWRRYATEEGSGWGTELGAWCWASALWVIGVGVVGTAVPVGVWWIASFSSTWVAPSGMRACQG
ncbi:hypothetical protein DFJ74DRAFT_660331 [Hyaloraphidium curvatum]|nr:hypothetical protein DFJ74DRAFT_660331 [Hyaloraphidium curvatum]